MFESNADAAKPADQAPQVAPPAMPNLDDLLGDFGRSHPDLAWMTQLLAAQRQRGANEEPPQDEPLRVELAALADELAQARARAAKLQDVARRLAVDLRSANARLSDLAAAFGACGLCWGEDPRCPGCRGRGRPGRFAPDPELRLRMFPEPTDVAAASRLSTHPDPPQGDEPWLSIPTN